MSTYGTRCAVWGDPISHSKSPNLHEAAYAELGLNWTYERRRVSAGELHEAIEQLDASWRGLSLTMPLKHAALAWGGTSIDPVAQTTGAANTACLNGPSTVRAWNTDVSGLVTALEESGIVPHDEPFTARVLGAGATATSAVAALRQISGGASEIQVLARRDVTVLDIATTRLEILSTQELAPAAVTISTLPHGVVLDEGLTRILASTGGNLFDVAYDPWPTRLANAWQGAGKTAVSGEGMLLHQAVAQIRIWLTGDISEPLPNEDRVVLRMREALSRA